MNFPPVAGFGLAAAAQDARVQFGAQAETMPAFAAFKADAAEPVALGQFAHRDLKNLGCWIKFQKPLFI
jgi:hypothetical protein